MNVASTRYTFALCSLAVLGTLLGCGGGDGAMVPESATLAYEQSSALPGIGDAFCNHHYAPLDLTVTTDQGDNISLSRTESIPTATLSQLTPGQHWIYVIDIRYCGARPECPTAQAGVLINNVRLTRQVPAGSNGPACTALAFTVSSNGQIGS